MKKLSLIVLSLLSVVFIQSCKKSDSSDDTTTTATPAFEVYVNAVLWTPISVKAVLTYDATAKTKTLTCTGIDTTDEVVLNIKQTATALDSTFTAQTYNIDASNVTPMYYTLNSSNVFVASGTVKSGYITITAFDEKNKLMTGTFSFVTTHLNYDSNGNVASITTNTISSGQFNSFPFKFVRQ